MAKISANLQAVRQCIAAAAQAAGRRPEAIRLLAMSKTVAPEHIREAATAGQRCFGENYAQEGLAKITALRELGLEWHFIGSLQSNKTHPVAEHFDWVHSIDRLKIAQRLSQAREGRSPLQVCMQVNISGETSKHGVAPHEVPALARAVAGLPNLRLRGLMAIPEPTVDVVMTRRRCAALRALLDGLNAAGFGLDTLSMGMSGDLEAAIAEGATIVRIGTAIFGERTRKTAI